MNYHATSSGICLPLAIIAGKARLSVTNVTGIAMKINNQPKNIYGRSIFLEIMVNQLVQY